MNIPMHIKRHSDALNFPELLLEFRGGTVDIDNVSYYRFNRCDQDFDLNIEIRLIQGKAHLSVDLYDEELEASIHEKPANRKALILLLASWNYPEAIKLARTYRIDKFLGI